LRRKRTSRRPSSRPGAVILIADPSCVEAAAALLCGTVSARAHFTKEMHKRAGERVLLQSIRNVLSSHFPPHQARVLKDR
jgi:hypothetical protein